MVPDTFSCSGLSLQNRCAGLLEWRGCHWRNQAGERGRMQSTRGGGVLALP